MQLIFETEATVNIVEKMTSLDVMPIAETKPDSPPNVNVIKESKCNSMEINNTDAVKPDENGISKEQNGDVNIAIMTGSDEPIDVVNEDKENYISAQNGNSDIAAGVSIESMPNKDTEIAHISPDSEYLMQVENKLPEMPDNLEIFNPENKNENMEFNSVVSDVINQENSVQENSNETETTIIKTHIDIKEKISNQQQKHNDITDVVITYIENVTHYSVKKTGDACEPNTDNMVLFPDYNEVKSDENKITESNQKVEIRSLDSATKAKLEPKNSIDDEFGATDCTEKESNAADHTPSTLNNNCQDEIKLTDNTQDRKSKSRELGTKTADEAQENKMEVTEHKEAINSPNEVLEHKKEGMEDGLKSTDVTHDNKVEVSFNREEVESTNEAEINKMDVTLHEDGNKSTNKSQEIMAATDEAQEYKQDVDDLIPFSNHEKGIKSYDVTQEPNIEATVHKHDIKSTDEVIEHEIEATDDKEKVKVSDDASEDKKQFAVPETEIKTINETQDNKMKVSDYKELIESSDETKENKITLSNQLNPSEEPCKPDLEESEKKTVDNNEESVNSDNIGSNACDKSILNSSKQENSVKELKENCIEKSCQVNSSGSPNIGNNVNNETQLQNMLMGDSDKIDNSEIQDTSEIARNQVNDMDFKALEAMDVDSTEDLFTDDLAVANKSVTPMDTVLDRAISDDIISVDSNKTVNLNTDIKSSPVTIIDCDEIQDTGNKQSYSLQNNTANEQVKQNVNELSKPKKSRSVCGLSNTLDILSDDDDCVEECKDKFTEKIESTAKENTCINLDEDDDVMLIDDPPTDKEPEVPNIDDYMQPQESESNNQEKEDNKNKNDQMNTINLDNDSEPETSKTSTHDDVCKDKVSASDEDYNIKAPEIGDKPERSIIVSPKEIQRPIIPENFLNAFKKNVVDMNRDELEEFCLMKIVEGIIDQTNLSEIKTKLKTMSSYVEEWKKKVIALTKQNRDLNIVLKTVQEEQKKRSEHHVAPLKITRSVGMQVYMAEVTDRNAAKRKPPQATPVARNNRDIPSRSSVKPNSAAMPIPVPRLVPALNNSPLKTRLPQQVQNATVTSNSPKQYSQNGLKTSPAQKSEKRPFSSMQSVTVDLTDDEPPTKQAATRNNAQQVPVRLVAQQQLMKPRAQMPMGNNPARKVFIPINPQNNIRPGQTITLKSVPPNARIRGPGPQNQAVPIRVQSNAVRGPRPNSNVRHPAPLPEVAKQQQPPNWKALPPAPDLKISKVENGIVISWKIEGYQEDSYEEIASYQLYAYQETSSPPSTLLWKKIGDVKALPLPMACTLTQFMAGYKYYFAVRAVDIRSRIGAFSLPGSILLLNK